MYGLTAPFHNLMNAQYLGRIAGSGTTISHVYINPAKLTEESLAGADKQCQAVTEGDQVASVVVGTK
jgi:hypothetical protein